ncbi:MAG: hypothetical protein KC417_13075, partial [Myxococcales bacterium]|nr:hypothetical protein [Myxococcales bacterium]
NEVMKVLTIIATIFMPLSFISGVYGMNFRVMPELEWRWGYPVALLVMLAIAGGLLSFFHRRGWLTSEKTPESIGGASIPPVNGGDTR